MRLLTTDDDGGLKIVSDFRHVPPYAILSHTWAEDPEEEVKLGDIQNGSATSRKSFHKLQFCLEQAKKDGLRHVWIDTCCIDQSNSVELSEAINSMFRWYRGADRCYVYLTDVPNRQRVDSQQDVSNGLSHPMDLLQHGLKEDFRESRWFTRGWTLQELLAPEIVQFYTWQGHCIGTREQHCRLINAITGIDETALLGTPLSSFTVERRFEWASQRQTKKDEDSIYCLLGIFNITMPLNYGERSEKARRRLYREINESQQDHDKHNLQDVQRHAAHSRNTRTESEDDSSIVRPNRGAAIIAMLRFEGMNSRRLNIGDALEDTCHWVLAHPLYRQWLGVDSSDQHSNFLWIKGHPGAGKSTLIKFLDQHTLRRVLVNHDNLMSFYFTTRGHDLERSVNGMYRTFIVQLCNSISDFEQDLADITIDGQPLTKFDQRSLHSLQILQRILKTLVQKLRRRRLYIFIDALDETDEDDVSRMISFLRTLQRQSTAQLLVCLASRHYPTLAIPDSLPLILDVEAGHQQDLKLYVDTHLHISNESRARSIKDEIFEKARGIFMWVVLVVELLNKEYRRGNIFLVQQKLEEIPTELSALFNEILRQGDVKPESLLLCLRLILYARLPLSLLELYHAMLSQQLGTEQYRQACHIVPTTEELRNFLVTNSKGLAEATMIVDEQGSLVLSERSPVQFIHKSVPDFLIEHQGLSSIFELCDVSTPHNAHEHIRICCLDAWETSSPFSHYAISDHVFSHANLAAQHVSQHDFCHYMAQFDRWRKIRNDLNQAAQIALIGISEPEHLLTYIVWAGHDELARFITQHELGSNLCSRMALHEALVFAVDHRQAENVQMLLDTGFAINTKNKFDDTVLHHAVAKRPGEHMEMGSRKKETIQLLLERGADVNAQNGFGSTALHSAVKHEDPWLAEVLLQAGANPDISNIHGHTSFHEPSRACAKLLGIDMTDNVSLPELKSQDHDAAEDALPALKSNDDSAVEEALQARAAWTSELDTDIPLSRTTQSWKSGRDAALALI